ncbi:MAG: glycosyltransferase family 2 protein, partial [Sphingomonadales bacterium]|nr:glycosyltransferase family 2 protein [Sphingomonadales bacterium]
SEMVVKASLHGLRIAEVPTTLSPDGRDRPPHLRSWRDGWRHLRFLLLFSPRWLFLYPGLVLGACGAAGLLALLPGPLAFGSVTLDVHTMLFFAGAVIAGAQMLTLALCSQVFAAEHGILPPSALVERFRRLFTFERGLLCGLALLAAGTAMSVESVLAWDRAHFGAFDPTVGMRIVIPSLTLAMLGLQTFFASLFLGVLDLRAHERPTARAR